jgi:hypothetical protein
MKKTPLLLIFIILKNRHCMALRTVGISKRMALGLIQIFYFTDYDGT